MLYAVIKIIMICLLLSLISFRNISAPAASAMKPNAISLTKLRSSKFVGVIFNTNGPAKTPTTIKPVINGSFIFSTEIEF